MRLYADKLQQSLGKPVIVENKPGAALMLAAAAVATAPPDGYTLLVSTSSAMAINLTLYKKVNYDAVKDFVPVSFYVKSPFILVVNPDLPAKTVPELIKLAKESATPLNFSSPGAGVAQHLSIEYMKQRFEREHDARAVSQHAAVDHRHRRRSRPARLRRGRRVAAADPRRQAARAGGVVLDRASRRCPTSRRSPKPPMRPASKRCLGTCCSRQRQRRNQIVDKLHAEMKKIMSDPEMKQKLATIGLLPIDHAVDRRHGSNTSPPSARSGASWCKRSRARRVAVES